VTISPEKLFYRKKRALRYIHPHALYVGFMAEMLELRLGLGLRN